MARLLKLMTDYHCHPLWDYVDPNDAPNNPDPAELPISAETVAGLNAWAAWFDSFLDPNELGGTRFIPLDEDAAFKQMGQQLWAALQSELGPTWRVVYFEDGKVLEPNQQANVNERNQLEAS